MKPIFLNESSFEDKDISANKTIPWPNEKCRKCKHCVLIEKRKQGNIICELDKCNYEERED